MFHTRGGCKPEVSSLNPAVRLEEFPSIAVRTTALPGCL